MRDGLFFVLFFLLPRPPTSTRTAVCSPYSTLFRSLFFGWVCRPRCALVLEILVVLSNSKLEELTTSVCGVLLQSMDAFGQNSTTMTLGCSREKRASVDSSGAYEKRRGHLLPA